MVLQDKLLLIGIILIFLGFIIIIASSIIQAKTNVKTGGIVFIGPFPLFGWAENKQIFYILIVLTILASIIFYLLRKL